MNLFQDRQPGAGQPPFAPGTVSGTPAPPNRKPLTRQLWFRAACALAPLVAIVLVVSTANHTSPRSSATSATPARTVQSTSAPSTSTTSVGAAGFGTATTIAPPGPPTSRTRSIASATASSGDDSSNPAGASAWGTAHSELLGELRTDVVNVAADATNGELPSLQGDCTRLQTDVQIAQTISPVPDPSGESLWNQALDDFGQAAPQCVTAAQDHNVSEIAEAAAATSSGGTALATLANQVKVPA
jgi:hypothetical protein